MARPIMLALVLFLPVLVGCASSQGFDQASMIEALHTDSTLDHNNQSLVQQTATPSPPYRLGIFLVDPALLTQPSIRKVEWLSMDRAELLRSLTPLREHGMLTDAFVLMDSTIRGKNISEIRQAGARYGADMVLIVDGVAAVRRSNNRYAWLYPTLIGAYLAPGTESEALILLSGSLWAARSEWHAPIQTAEGTAKVVGPAVSVEDADAVQEAKTRAIQLLGQHIVEQLQHLGK